MYEILTCTRSCILWDKTVAWLYQIFCHVCAICLKLQQTVLKIKKNDGDQKEF